MKMKFQLVSVYSPLTIALGKLIVMGILSNLKMANCFNLSFGSRLFRADGQPIIRPLECRNSLNQSETGICMFSIDCMQNKGTPLSICKHNYFVGTCCRLPDQQNFASIVYDLKETLPPTAQMSILPMATQSFTLSPVTTTIGERLHPISSAGTPIPNDLLSSSPGIGTNGFKDRDSILSSSKLSNLVINSKQPLSATGQDNDLERFSYSVAPTTTLEATTTIFQYNQEKSASQPPPSDEIPNLIQQQIMLNSLTTPIAATRNNDSIKISNNNDNYTDTMTTIFVNNKHSQKPPSIASESKGAEQTISFTTGDFSRVSNQSHISNLKKPLEQQRPLYQQQQQLSTKQPTRETTLSHQQHANGPISAVLDIGLSSTQWLDKGSTTNRKTDNTFLSNGQENQIDRILSSQITNQDNKTQSIKKTDTTQINSPESLQQQPISVIIPNEIDSFQIQSTATVMSSASVTPTTSFPISSISAIFPNNYKSTVSETDQYRNQYQSQTPPSVLISTGIGYGSTQFSSIVQNLMPNRSNLQILEKFNLDGSLQQQPTKFDSYKVVLDNSAQKPLDQSPSFLVNRPTQMGHGNSDNINIDKEQLINRPYSLLGIEPTQSSAMHESQTEVRKQQYQPNQETNQLSNNLENYESMISESPIMSTRLPSTVSITNTSTNTTTSSHKLSMSNSEGYSSDSSTSTKIADVNLTSRPHEVTLASQQTISVTSLAPDSSTSEYIDVGQKQPSPIGFISQQKNPDNSLLDDITSQTTIATISYDHESLTDPLKPLQTALNTKVKYPTKLDNQQDVANDSGKSDQDTGKLEGIMNQSLSSTAADNLSSQSTQAQYSTSNPSSPIYSLISSTLLSSIMSNPSSSSLFTASLTTPTLPAMTTNESNRSSSAATSNPINDKLKQNNTVKENVTSNQTMLVPNSITKTNYSGNIGNNKIVYYHNNQHNQNQIHPDSQRPLFSILQPLHAATKVVPSNFMSSNNLIPGFGGLPSTILSHIPSKISSFSTGLTNYLSSAMKPGPKPLITSNTAPALQFLQQLAANTTANSSTFNFISPNKLSASNGGFIKFPGQSSSNVSAGITTQNTTSTTTTIKSSSDTDESISSLSPPLGSLKSNLSVPESSNKDSVDMLDILGKAKLICGRPQVPMARIVGGRRSNFGQWPWMVSLRQWRKGAFLHKCGAALLNEHWAITAAHCVDKVKAADLLLRLGEFDVSNQMEPYPYVEKRVKQIVSHPSFDPKTFEYDLALLRFAEPVKYQRNIVPVCIPTGNDTYVDRLATVIGWGRLYEDGPLPDVIQHVDVPIITNKECEKMYKHAGYIEEIPDMFICAGISKGGKDSCEGDSGGPLTMVDHDGRSYLVGIISWGIGCALPSQPGVYTRITAFSDWINRIVAF